MRAAREKAELDYAIALSKGIILYSGSNVAENMPNTSTLEGQNDASCTAHVEKQTFSDLLRHRERHVPPKVFVVWLSPECSLQFRCDDEE